MMEDKEWLQYKIFLIETLSRLEKDQKETQKNLDKVHEELIALKSEYKWFGKGATAAIGMVFGLIGAWFQNLIHF